MGQAKLWSFSVQLRCCNAGGFLWWANGVSLGAWLVISALAGRAAGLQHVPSWNPRREDAPESSSQGRGQLAFLHRAAASCSSGRKPLPGSWCPLSIPFLHLIYRSCRLCPWECLIPFCHSTEVVQGAGGAELSVLGPSLLFINLGFKPQSMKPQRDVLCGLDSDGRWAECFSAKKKKQNKQKTLTSLAKGFSLSLTSGPCSSSCYSHLALILWMEVNCLKASWGLCGFGAKKNSAQFKVPFSSCEAEPWSCLFRCTRGVVDKLLLGLGLSWLFLDNRQILVM